MTAWTRVMRRWRRSRWKANGKRVEAPFRRRECTHRRYPALDPCKQSGKNHCMNRFRVGVMDTALVGHPAVDAVAGPIMMPRLVSRLVFGSRSSQRTVAAGTMDA